VVFEAVIVLYTSVPSLTVATISRILTAKNERLDDSMGSHNLIKDNSLPIPTVLDVR
jgi:hypothetical protein